MASDFWPAPVVVGPPHSAGRCLQGLCRWVPPNEVASIFYEEQVILFSQIKTGEGGGGGGGGERGQIQGEESKPENRSFLSSLFLPFTPLPLLPPPFLSSLLYS